VYSGTYLDGTSCLCRWEQSGGQPAAAMDDLERAILYSFDETGAVAPELKVLRAEAHGMEHREHALC